MKVQVFLQSELLNDIEVIDVKPDGGHAALRDACLAKVNWPTDQEVCLFIENEDDEHALENLEKIPQGLCVHLCQTACKNDPLRGLIGVQN